MGVVVHPGAFYGIGEMGRVVVSLLGPAGEFSDGLGRIKSSISLNQDSY
jgi:alanine-synthesizing transaminase